MNSKTTYITKDGLDKLRAELDEMLAVRRPEIAQRIHDAKEHGDLSENAEYEDAKNEQAFVEGRIQTLEVDDQERHPDRRAHLDGPCPDRLDGQGRRATRAPETFMIVGSAEAKPANGGISNESPGRARPAGRKKGERSW